MSTKEVRVKETAAHPSAATVDMKLEVAVISVSDADRAKEFYSRLGWRLDADFDTGDGFRVIQFTPNGSGCSVQFGTTVTPAPPGSAEGFLAVSDIEAARKELAAAGIEVSEVFHGGEKSPAAKAERSRISGLDPQRRSYRSFAAFSDPDGNKWLLQEITTRLPGRIDPAATSFGSANDLESALPRAAAAHGEHEKRTGQRDENWPVWYAKYIVAEQAGTELPK